MFKVVREGNIEPQWISVHKIPPSLLTKHYVAKFQKRKDRRIHI